MSNQLAVVTGASSGIGYNLANVFAEKASIVIASSGDAWNQPQQISKHWV